MQFEDSFFQEEIREGYVVSEKMKGVWAAELNMLGIFDALCREHNLHYFVEYGTLLGAVRHQGFVPWDNDIDVMMFRDEYEKFNLIAKENICSPYFFQNSYTDSMIMSLSKIRDSRTTAITSYDYPIEYNQGIFIDIFPFDDIPDGITVKPTIGEMQFEIWLAIANPESLLDLMEERVNLAFDYKLLADVIKMPISQSMRVFEDFNLSQFGKSSKVDFLTSFFKGYPGVLREWYADTVYLPFENMMVPAPAGYDAILKYRYGDYMKPVQGLSAHEGIIFDPYVPYRQYMESEQRTVIK